MAEPVALFWSGGKDSALALDSLIESKEDYEVTLLISTLVKDNQRVGMHQVREELIEQQAASINIPLKKTWIPLNANNEEYERMLDELYISLMQSGIHHVAFGDIHLGEVREYRDNHLSGYELKAIYPVWGEESDLLFNKFVKKGFKAVTVCIEDGKLHECWLGRNLDYQFFTELPESIDSCGENGEYHSFVHDGPIFKYPILFEHGERYKNKGFHYFDLLPAKLE